MAVERPPRRAQTPENQSGSKPAWVRPRTIISEHCGDEGWRSVRKLRPSLVERGKKGWAAGAEGREILHFSAAGVLEEPCLGQEGVHLANGVECGIDGFTVAALVAFALLVVLHFDGVAGGAAGELGVAVGGCRGRDRGQPPAGPAQYGCMGIVTRSMRTTASLFMGKSSFLGTPWNRVRDFMRRL